MTQFVDIAVAFGFGLLCLALIISISPVVSREAAVQEAAQAKADIALSSYVQHVGLPFLNSSTPASICNSTEQDSNSTLVVTVLVDGVDSCGGSTPTGSLASASLALSFPNRTILARTSLVR